MKPAFFAFVAGFLAVPFFHQPALWLLGMAGVTDRAPFGMQPTQPLGVPSWISLAFWGGVWGVVLWLALRNSGRRFIPYAILFGAVAPTLVAWFIAAPLKGQPVAGGWNPSGMVTGLIVNAAWGLGAALLIRASGVMKPVRHE